MKYIALPILNIKITKKGSVINKPALYVGNHRTFSDPMVMCRFVDGFVIAKAEVSNYPIINKGAELTGVIWVNRDNKNSRSETRTKLLETIESGYNVIVYPEGTVGKEKLSLPFRKGTFMEAASNNISIVPVAIEYKSSKDLWVKEKFIPQYLFQFSKWKTEVKLTFGPEMQNSDGESLTKSAKSWIDATISEMQENWSEKF